jgi:lysozyme family protein
MSAFDQAFELLIGHEGGFTDHRADPGNWTGGKVGSGTLKGIKLGISAASFPTLDILALTLDDARAIYRRLYWDRVHGDQLPPALALLVFDAAVNNGVARAARLLQAAIGTPDDGLIGTGTMAALARPEQRQPRPGGHVAAEFQACCIVFMAALSTWSTFGLGWARRLACSPSRPCAWPPERTSHERHADRRCCHGAAEPGRRGPCALGRQAAPQGEEQLPGQDRWRGQPRRQPHQRHAGRQGRNAWFDSVSWRMYAAVQNTDTAKSVSDAAGGHSVLAESEGNNTGSQGKPLEAGSRSKGTSMNRHEMARALIRSDELMQDMRGDEAFVFARGSKPLRCGRAIYFRRPSFG